MPRNAATGQRYRGINVLTLGMSTPAFSSGDPRWATYKQAEDRGWQVGKGERGATGYFFKKFELRDDSKPDDSEDSVRRIPLLRAFHLFHAGQIDGVPEYVPPTIEEAPWRAGSRRNHHRQQQRGRSLRRRARVLFSVDGSHSDATAGRLRHGGRILRDADSRGIALDRCGVAAQPRSAQSLRLA
jgi:N-terminal domain of anti-restriction factor ArdC